MHVVVVMVLYQCRMENFLRYNANNCNFSNARHVPLLTLSKLWTVNDSGFRNNEHDVKVLLKESLLDSLLNIISSYVVNISKTSWKLRRTSLSNGCYSRTLYYLLDRHKIDTLVKEIAAQNWYTSEEIAPQSWYTFQQSINHKTKTIPLPFTWHHSVSSFVTWLCSRFKPMTFTVTICNMVYNLTPIIHLRY